MKTIGFTFSKEKIPESPPEEKISGTSQEESNGTQTRGRRKPKPEEENN